MPNVGYTGISFPFRVTSRGGVAMSTCTEVNPQHIKESLQQILLTGQYQRPMEEEVFSNLSASLFEPNDESLQQVLKSRIIDAFTRLEQRIEIEEDDIEFEVVDDDRGSILYAVCTYKVIKFDTYYTSKIKIGETINE